MIVISHRGYWKHAAEKNTKNAFLRSFTMGFGTETDIRDYNGKLVISHDIPDENSISVKDFFELLHDKSLPLALNIKSDGLKDLLVKEIETYGIKNAFVFDMSVPDQLHYYQQSSFQVYSRMSEQEIKPAFYLESDGIWLDCFFEIWYTESDINNILADGKNICIVSPELHKRDHLDFWNSLRESNIHLDDRIMLCTDLPEEAALFFKA